MFKKVLVLSGTFLLFVTSTNFTVLNENADPQVSLTSLEGSTCPEHSTTHDFSKALDNNSSTKWFASNSTNNFYAIFEASVQIRLTSYSLMTADDTSTYSNRNLKTWKISGSNTRLSKDSSDWVEIVNHTTALPSSSDHTEYSFSDVSNNNKSYKYYKLDCTTGDVADETRSSKTDSRVLQLAEFKFFGNESYSITYMDGSEEITSLSPTYYDKGVGVTSLPNASKAGYEFVGWYDANEGGNQVTSISTSETGNKVLYAKFNVTSTITSIGGYVKKDNSKQKIVGFGVTFGDYAQLNSGDTCGIYVYSDSGSSIVKTFSTTDVSAVKAKQGRFYCIHEVDNTNTYYAKGYVIIGGKYSYTSLVSATANETTEYSV